MGEKRTLEGEERNSGINLGFDLCTGQLRDGSWPSFS